MTTTPTYEWLLRRKWRVTGVNIAVHSGGYFHEDPTGNPAIVIAADNDDKPCDHVAWRYGAPDSWYVHTGLAVRLGEENVTRAMGGDVPLLLFHNPENWLVRLYTGQKGCCVLQPAGWQSLSYINEIHCEDIPLGRKLEKELERVRGARPKIMVLREKWTRS